MEALENLPPSIEWLDTSGNELTSDCGGLGLLAGLEALLMAGNELGPELPKTLASLNTLEELNVNDNHVNSLKNVPKNLLSLHLNRNHLEGTLKVRGRKAKSEERKASRWRRFGAHTRPITNPAPLLCSLPRISFAVFEPPRTPHGTSHIGE